ncbi:LysM peptidoglycan-binding domain-containing protein, partial [Sinorhizobium meliloti]
AAAAAEASKAATTALDALKAAPQDPSSVAAAVEKVDGALGSALTRQNVGTSVASAEPLAVQANDASKQPEPSAAGETNATVVEQAAAPASDAAKEQPATIEQAPLKESKTSVIIRRGDTLWQISRRVYGAGLRYTTIYLANREQIENPDLIRPGQVFGVPDEALSEEESREVHRKHMRH